MNTTFTVTSKTGSGIKKEEARALSEALKVNTTLKTLNLQRK